MLFAVLERRCLSRLSYYFDVVMLCKVNSNKARLSHRAPANKNLTWSRSELTTPFFLFIHLESSIKIYLCRSITTQV
jgi:hypothetical protein